MARKRRILILSLGALLGLGLVAGSWPRWWPHGQPVPAQVETYPVPSDSDAADDPALWRHPSDPTLSLVIGSDKDGGLAVYDLEGRQRQYLADGRMNNVDLRQGVPWGAEQVDLVVATDRRAEALACYRVDVATRLLVPLGTIPCGAEIYGLCLYRPADASGIYAFVTGAEGQVTQWRLSADAAGRPQGEIVRTLPFDSLTEGCVADDEAGVLFVAEEDHGVWRVNAAPEAAASERQLILRVGQEPAVRADLEGLTLYTLPGGAGYLLLSCQGANAFGVLERQPPHRWLGSFRLVGSNGVDKVTGTDGIAADSGDWGPDFPGGLFVAQDDKNPGANQNFKLVAWSRLAHAFDPPLVQAGKPPVVPAPGAASQP